MGNLDIAFEDTGTGNVAMVELLIQLIIERTGVGAFVKSMRASSRPCL